ncbi:MAG: ExeA family protein, partial [Candidatus Binatia bacterium]
DGKSRLTMLQQLNDYLIDQLQKGHTVSLLIDEAQNLSDEALEELRLLSNLETDKEKLLQIVLMGQPELEVKLDQPQLRQLKQRVALQCRLARLGDQEVGPFIDFRLRAAGYEGEGLFNPDAVKQIAFYSKGIPRLINIICDNALLTAYAGSRKTVSTDIIRDVAQDLRLGPRVQNIEVEPTTAKVMAKNGRNEALQPVAQETSRYKGRRLVGAGVGTLLVILFLGGAAFLTDHPLWGLSLDAEKLLSIAGKRLEILKHELNEWVMFPTNREAELPKVQRTHSPEDSEPGLQSREHSVPSRDSLALARQTKSVSPSDFHKREDVWVREGASTNTRPLAEAKRVIAEEWPDRPMVIQYGSTIFNIATDVYGAKRILAMDLIKEFNPQIQNLNWVFAGQNLRLPPLTQETLLRKQPDGSYRLIVASFPSSIGADEFAKLVRTRGYQVVIKRQTAADNLFLHRVEIEGLENLQAANQAWDIALKNQWFSFVEKPKGKQRQEEAR